MQVLETGGALNRNTYTQEEVKSQCVLIGCGRGQSKHGSPGPAEDEKQIVETIIIGQSAGSRQLSILTRACPSETIK